MWPRARYFLVNEMDCRAGTLHKGRKNIQNDEKLFKTPENTTKSSTKPAASDLQSTAIKHKARRRSERHHSITILSNGVLKTISTRRALVPRRPSNHSWLRHRNFLRHRLPKIRSKLQQWKLLQQRRRPSRR